MHHLFEIYQLFLKAMLFLFYFCWIVCQLYLGSFLYAINFLCLILDLQTLCCVRFLLKNHHKIVWLALCINDDSTYQV